MDALRTIDGKENEDKLEVEVGGDVMSGLSVREKEETLRASLIALDMMGSVLGRVEEFIQLNGSDEEK